MKSYVLKRWMFVALLVAAGFILTLTRTGQATPLEAPSPLVTGPGAGKIVFMSNRDGNNEIYIINPDGTGETRLTNDPANDQTPTISPDGNKIVFSSNGNICEMNIDGTNKVPLVTGSTNIQPVYSPDGSQIAFSSNRACCDFDVWLVDRDGSNLHRLTFNQLGDYDASWGPVPNQLIFGTFYGNNYQAELTRINTDGTGQTRITNGAGGSDGGSWGSHNKIAFKSGRDGNNEIYTCDPDGGNVDRITNNAFQDVEPSWSPDGQHIAFTSSRHGNNELYVMNADGTGTTRITTNASSDSAPFWGPSPNTPVTPGASISDITVTEGDANTLQAEFTVSLSAAASTPVTLDYATTGQTATSGTDFTPTSGSLNFPIGTTARTISVPITGDLLSEDSETFVVTLSNIVGANGYRTSATATIIDNDPLPSLSINSQSLSEGNSGLKTMTFTVFLSAASGRQVTVNYSTVAGSAAAGTDFQAASGTLTFDEGETVKTIPVQIVGDTQGELDETFAVRLSNAVGASLPIQPVFNPVNNHYYEAVDVSLTWAQAKAAAEGRVFGGVAGHLVSITSAEEQSFINTAFGAPVHTLIGGTQPSGSPEPGGNWQWVTGEPFTYSNWYFNEPNNVLNAENSIEMITGGKWNDILSTDAKPRYIVEYDFTSPPTGPAEPQGIGTILDDDGVPTLQLSLAPGETLENAGTNAVNASITRSYSSTSAALTVTLGSSDTTEASVPTTVVIPAGAGSVSFKIAAVDDLVLDGPQTVIITASAGGFAPASSNLTVLDNEVSSIRGRVATSSGTGLANVGIRRNGTVTVYTDSNGNYVFNNVPFGNHTLAPVITPALSSVTFSPATRTVPNTTSGLTNINFTAGFSVSGVVANHSGIGIPNVLVLRTSGSSSTGVYTDSNGAYRFTNVQSGSYTIAPQVTPALSGAGFSPTARSVTVGTNSHTNINFNVTFTISGFVTNHSGQGIPNIQVMRSIGSSVVSVFTDSSGAYRFTGARSGAYTIAPQLTPALSGTSFFPVSRSATVTTGNLTNINFNATFTVSGRVTSSGGLGIEGVSVVLGSGPGARTTISDENGNYSFADVRSGTYTVTPAKQGLGFSPASRSAGVGTSDVKNVNFIGM